MCVDVRVSVRWGWKIEKVRDAKWDCRESKREKKKGKERRRFSPIIPRDILRATNPQATPSEKGAVKIH